MHYATDSGRAYPVLELGLALTAGFLCASPAMAIDVDGTRDAAYGPPIVVQTVETQFGDAMPPGSLNGSELDAAYARVEGGRLYLMFTGNLEPNFNKLDVFIDSKAGGENTLSPTPDYDFFDPGGCGGGGCWISTNLNGLTFDAGFNADYHLFAKWGGGGSPGPFEVDFVDRQGGGAAMVPGSAGVGSATVGLVSTGMIAAGSVGPNASGTALTQALEFAINDNNAAGVVGGTGAADQAAAAAVTTGMEFSIDLADLGDPPPGSVIVISAMINNGDHNFLSNQILGGLQAPQGNLGGDGAGGFIGDLSGVDFGAFAGSQDFALDTPDEPGACCLNPGCVIVTADDCAAQGGGFQGAGIPCTPDPCDNGACCLPGTVCQQLTEAQCLMQGGVFQGPGIPCTPDPCDPGACCLTAAPCAQLTEAQCLMQGGIFQGPGIPCAPDPCDPGACCLTAAPCAQLTEAQCLMQGGTFQGPGIPCAPDPCDPGACCLTAQPCAQLTEAQCLMQGGTFQGPGIPCAPDPCDLGACCLTAAPCAQLTEAQCLTQGGVFQGPGIPCTPDPCDPGACCLTAAPCAELTEAQCLMQGGVFQGAGIPCTPDPCDPGACCLTAAPCAELTEAQCLMQGGIFQGPGVPCAPDPCDPGACCVPNPGCAQLTEAQCLTQGGVFQGPGIPCTPDPCDPGACCLTAAPCAELTEAQCLTQGGTFQGPGIPCTPDPCDSGACCVPNPGCAQLTEADCIAAGGVFKGAGVPCDPEPCTPGACCLSLQGCADLTEAECVTMGGLFLGGGTSCAGNPCTEPGWNWVDNKITLTANEPAYWSVATGQPKGVSPFTVLDPGTPPGRPAMDGTGDRVLRGYVIGWAASNTGEEIRWNHLKGEGTIINYRDALAWEYNAFAHQAVDDLVAHGEATGSPGELHLDGLEYAASYGELLLNFQAADSGAFSNGPAGFMVMSDTDLTLHPVPADLRQSGDGPVTTKASMDIWNENETKFSGTHRCITCWDQTLISRYETPNHFLRAFLQTDHGKARIEGEAANVCNELDDPDTPEDESVTSVDAPLLGVSARYLAINGVAPMFDAAAGSNLLGMGLDDTAVVRYDAGDGGGPPEAEDEDVDALLTWLDRELRERGSLDDGQESAREPQAMSGVLQDRVSGTEKGSLLFFSKVELRWSAAPPFALIQDTFLSITNDYPEDVQVQLYFVNGDAPTTAP